MVIMEIQRNIHLNRLISGRHNGMIKVVTGLRRCGKSYLLFNLFAKYLRNEGVDDAHIIKVNLEDRRNLALRDPDNLLAHIDSKLKDDQMHYILLDEVQFVSHFEDVLNSFLHVNNADVYVTGSNAKFLSKDVITEFRGRGDEIRLRPLSFQEFVSVREGMDKADALDEYLTYGGLPQVVLMDSPVEKRKYLKNLFLHTYLRDIQERHKIKNDADLEELVNIIASSIGGLINPRKIMNTFRSVKHSDISQDTIKRYLDHLEYAFLIEKALRYDIKGKRYIDTPAKYYFDDLGLRNARLNFRQTEPTHLLENAVYNELNLRGYSVDVGQVNQFVTGDDGKRARRTLEVDFVCNEGYRRSYIQVAYRLPDEEKIDQELNSLRNIKDSFQKVVIVGGHYPTYQNEEGIYFMSIYDFLLDEKLLFN